MNLFKADVSVCQFRNNELMNTVPQFTLCVVHGWIEAAAEEANTHYMIFVQIHYLVSIRTIMYIIKVLYNSIHT